MTERNNDIKNTHFKPSKQPSEAWHKHEFINAIAPDGTKYKLGYNFFKNVMRIWMFGSTHHTAQQLREAGWHLVMPIQARR